MCSDIWQETLTTATLLYLKMYKYRAMYYIYCNILLDKFNQHLGAVVPRAEVKLGMLAKVGIRERLDRLSRVQTPQLDGLIRGGDELDAVSAATDKLEREDPT